MDIVWPLEGYTEEQLIQACVRNERWAQKILYESSYSSLMGVSIRYSNNSSEAQDILHEGYIKIFKHISKYKVNTSLNAWMKRIIINTSIDYYRKASRRRYEDVETVYNISSKDASAISQATQKEIIAAVQSLSPAYRTVFNLYVIEGYSHREIAEKLKINESTSRSNLVKARAKLKVILTTNNNYGIQ